MRHIINYNQYLTENSSFESGLQIAMEEFKEMGFLPMSKQTINEISNLTLVLGTNGDEDQWQKSIWKLKNEKPIESFVPLLMQSPTKEWGIIIQAHTPDNKVIFFNVSDYTFNPKTKMLVSVNTKMLPDKGMRIDDPNDIRKYGEAFKTYLTERIKNLPLEYKRWTTKIR